MARHVVAPLTAGVDKRMVLANPDSRRAIESELNQGTNGSTLLGIK
ncbi:hypothetical protein SynBIOSU31_00693 [Synechococcus sp. BIOS-U3-1]|nr:hypothetical protein SynBIOSU31_00693 [Synechococcus sp. BIOS-U3-1]